MACLALGGRCLEINIHQRNGRVRRFVTIDALRDRMRVPQRKAGPGVIEFGEFLPGFGGMTRFALKRPAARFLLLLKCCESPLVRVGVATRARQGLPVIARGGFRCEIPRRLVAIAARNGHMLSAKCKWSLIVPAQAECGGQKPLETVAILAAIEVWCGTELSGMLISVTVGTALELHFVNFVLALRKMTLAAL
jgi:hypothetical protein